MNRQSIQRFSLTLCASLTGLLVITNLGEPTYAVFHRLREANGLLGLLATAVLVPAAFNLVSRWGRQMALVLLLTALIAQVGALYLLRGQCGREQILMLALKGDRGEAVLERRSCGATTADEYLVILREKVGLLHRESVVFRSYERPIPVTMELDGAGRLSIITRDVFGQESFEIEFDPRTLKPHERLRFYRGDRIDKTSSRAAGTRQDQVEDVVVRGGHVTDASTSLATHVPVPALENTAARRSGPAVSYAVAVEEQYRTLIEQSLPPGATIDFAGTVTMEDGRLPLFVTSEPIVDPIHDVQPVERDQLSRVFVFLEQKPTEVARDVFRRPGDAVWETVECGPIRLLPLGKGKPLPAVLAQHCALEGESAFLFIVLDKKVIEAPVAGTATWMYADDPDAPREAFTPNDDQALVPGVTPNHGDGETLLEGFETKVSKDAEGQDQYWERYYRLVWDGTGMKRVEGNWEPTE